MSSPDFSAWSSQINQFSNDIIDSSAIPAVIHDDIMKSKMDFGVPQRGFKSLLADPLAVQYALGYKDRKYSLTYDVLKRIPHQLGVVAAILQTRCNQVAAFSVPYRESKSVGFQIKHKNPGHSTSKSEVEFIADLEKFVYNCGAPDPNPHNKVKRDDFETFLKKIVRDSLMYDQSVFEIVPDRLGQPYEFLAVDASTIRIAAADEIFGPNDTYQRRSPILSQDLMDQRAPFKAMQLMSSEKDGERPDFVQLINGQIENVYFRNELAFGVRNPRTDIYIQGYGYGEMEQLITILTAHLYAEEYNRRFFMQGSAPKGLLNFKGENFTPDMLEGFKRQWRANLEGVENSWKTPILQAEQGVEWIDLHPSNREMEYGQWVEYLIKITCAVFLMDPAELNFDLHGGVQQTPLFESSQEWKLKASRDRGLKPLLRFIAKQINEHVIGPIDDHFVFDFVGLDELTEQEKHELRQEQVASYMTLNEIRRAEDLPDVEDGDTILNPTYIQARQARMQHEAEQAATEQEDQANSAAGEAPPPAPAGADTQGQQANTAPEYAGTFRKSQEDSRIITIDLDTYKNMFKG